MSGMDEQRQGDVQASDGLVRRGHGKARRRQFWLLLAALAMIGGAVLLQADSLCLVFDGVSNYVELDNGADFSVPTTGALTVSAWMRPDTLNYPSGYAHWLGKGTGSGPSGQQEWAFRLYSDDYPTVGQRKSVSFYVFSPEGGLGVGSKFVDDLQPLQWIHVVGMIDGQRTYIYKNGVFRQCNNYLGDQSDPCKPYCPNGVCLQITPRQGTAPVRMGTRDDITQNSVFFKGGLMKVRVWNRLLSDPEIVALYTSDQVPPDGLVAEYLLNSDTGNDAIDTTGKHTAFGGISGATWGPQ